MTMTTADTGVLSAAGHDHHVEKKDYSAVMYLLAAVILLIGVGAVAFMGIGGLILVGVGATWSMLLLLVIMTAGG